jgi:hypothetical protein
MEVAVTAAQTPSAALASITVDRLIEQGLLRPDKREAIIAKIATGTMKGEDWRSEIDFAHLKKAQS